MKLVTVTLAAGTALLAMGPTLSAQSNPKGEQIFKQRCAACHSLVSGKAGVGPSLAGVLGRKAGQTAFAYSPALKASGIDWTKPTLDKYLAAPTKAVPGTRMVVAVSNPTERAALITFLSTKR